jgi:MFS family permease
MAALGAASALGLTLGPALAALLSARGLMTPLYVTALLPLLAGGALALTMKDSAPVGSLDGGPRLGLTDPRLRTPMVVSFLAMASVSIAQIVVGFYAIDRLGLSADRAARVAGMALSGVGVALVLAQVLVQRLKASPTDMIAAGLALAAIGFGSAWAASSAALLCASYATAAFGMGFVFPSFSALASSSVSAREQGAAQGSISAAQGLGVVIGPSLGTALYEFSPVLPYLFASLLLALTAFWVWRRRAVPSV